MKNSYKILFIDDDKTNIQAVRNQLCSSTAFYELEVVHRGDQAFKILSRVTNFDCILLDYHLPDLNAIEFIITLKEKKINLPVIILTSEADEKTAVTALKNGAYDYLSKKSLAESEFKDQLSLSIIDAIKTHQQNINKVLSRMALEMSEERYRSLIENSPMLIFRVFPDDNTISFVNDGFCQYFKITRIEMIGEEIFSLIGVDNRDDILAKILSINYENQIVNFELETERDGTKSWQTWAYQGIFDEQGNIVEYQGMGKDVTELKNVEYALLEQKRFLKSILDSQENMIIVANTKEIIEANSSFLEFLEYKEFSRGEKNYKTMFDAIVKIEGYLPKPKKGEGMEVIYKNSIEQKLIAFQPPGKSYPQFFSISLSQLNIADDTYVIEFANVTKLEEKSKEFEELAEHDDLTKIYNRRKMDYMLESHTNVARRYKTNLSIIYFDIDHFKKINDKFGHNVGDSVLKELTTIVYRNIRLADIFARWGGEEFLILSPETKYSAALDLAEKTRELIEKYVFTYVKNVTCSFGVTQFLFDDTIETYLERSDEALYQAKENGRNCVVGIYDKKVGENDDNWNSKRDQKK